MAVRRCPACGLINRPTVTQCQCGQGFDEPPEDLRHLHMHRLTLGWMMVIGGLLGLLASIPLVFVINALAAFPATACAGVMMKGSVMVRYAREGLRALPAIPKARLLG